MSHHRVQAEALCYDYPDGTPALKDISFLITHGESVAVIGPNGAGKSTLALHLNGSLLAKSGSVVIGDVPVGAKTLAAVRRSVGLVFQDPDDQLFMHSVYDDVAFGPLNLGLDATQVESCVKKALDTVGLWQLRGKAPYRLSGGEKKRAAIAAVLSVSPDVLVMDEPTANLDPKGRRMLIELLGKFEHTKIIATHDLDMAAELCDRAIVLQDGKIAADDRIEKIFSDTELLDRCSLEKPLSMQNCPICGK